MYIPLEITCHQAQQRRAETSLVLIARAGKLLEIKNQAFVGSMP
jgi:hypothetical protein